MMLSISRILLFSAIIQSVTSLAVALDELRFPNGERLVGRIVEESETDVKFSSNSLGELTVRKSAAQIVRNVPNTPVESLVGIAPLPAPSSPVPRARSEAAPVAATAPPPVATTPPWQGKVELGFRHLDGRQNSLNFDLRASAERKLERDSLLANARFLYGEQNDVPSNDRLDASFRWRRQLGARVFAQSLTSYSRDEIKRIDHNWEQNFGAGFEIFKNDTHTVNLGAGLTGQYREAQSVASGMFGLVEVFEDYSFRINGRLTLVQNAVVQYSPDGQGQFTSVPNQPSNTGDGGENYKLRFNTTLQGKISERVSLNLRYEYERDNAVIERQARADQRITSSLGYAF